MEKLIKEIQNKLIENAVSSKKVWWEKYMKGIIRFYGVGIPDIRKIIKDREIGLLSTKEQEILADSLISLPHTEEKLASILILQMYWKDKIDLKRQLKLISSWFDKKYIFDWNTCDWLCVRVLTPMVYRNSPIVIDEFRQWNKEKYLWKARASLVPFAQAKNLKIHSDIVRHFCSVLIKRKERFSKTAVGWVLREASTFDKDYVHSFLEEHAEWISREVYKNATKYF